MEWISVKDKLPGKYDEVIVFDGKGACVSIYDGNDFTSPDSEVLPTVYTGITYWMPLPEPYTLKISKND